MYITNASPVVSHIVDCISHFSFLRYIRVSSLEQKYFSSLGCISKRSCESLSDTAGDVSSRDRDSSNETEDADDRLDGGLTVVVFTWMLAHKLVTKSICCLIFWIDLFSIWKSSFSRIHCWSILGLRQWTSDWIMLVCTRILSISMPEEMTAGNSDICLTLYSEQILLKTIA